MKHRNKEIPRYIASGNIKEAVDLLVSLTERSPCYMEAVMLSLQYNQIEQAYVHLVEEKKFQLATYRKETRKIAAKILDILSEYQKSKRK